MANKIMHAGLEFAGGGSGGGTTVIANPETASTDDLDTVQIGETVYNVHGNVITLTQAAYDLLPSTEKMDPTKVFYITDSVSTDTVIVPNPESSATDELTKLQIDSTVYSLAGGSEVEANPAGTATDELTKIGIDSTIYSLAGGTEVEANPVDPATDTLSKIDIDGTIYGVDVSNNDYFGAFIDTNNVIQASTQVTSQATYTASEDCAVVVIYSATSSTQSTISINSVIVLAIGGVATTLRNVLYMKRGDVLTFTPAGTYNSYEVYGLKSGSESNFFQPVIYSTAEREIGVWTDNKPLYEKTIFKTYDSTMKGTEYQWDHGIENIDQCVTAEGYFQRSGGIQGNRAQPTSISSGTASYNGNLSVMLFNFDRTKTMWHLGNTWSQSEYLPDCLVAILRYTKTTDVAGSGSYTTLGTPAIHYSTNEQVIGTWIDGSTLYQKSMILNNALNTSIYTFTDEQCVRITEAYGLSNDFSGTISPLNYYYSSNDRLSVYSNTTDIRTETTSDTLSSYPKVLVTIQYTKSTS